MERSEGNIHGHLVLALVAFVALAFITGGSAQVAGRDDLLVQLLAVPVLAGSAWLLATGTPSPWRKLGLTAAALVALVPALQLLPLSSGAWHWPEARQLLGRDLALAGVSPRMRWSLDPAATERALWWLLPALAAFVATLALPERRHRTLLAAVAALALSSLFLGFAQLGVPAESVLNPFPEWAAKLNGVFANGNHQAISLVVALGIALAWTLHPVPSAERPRTAAWVRWGWGFAALLSLGVLPLVGSSAAILIAILVVATVPVLVGLPSQGRRLPRGWGLVALAACVVLVALVGWSALEWMRSGAADEVRAPLRAATFALGREHAPFGTGMGAFVPAFEQGAPDLLLRRYYVNHAHNEYLQWWMEAGWLGVLVLATVLAIIGTASVVALRRRDGDRMPAAAAATGLGALLLHSWVDYPMRTVSLATVAAVLCGILLSRAHGAVAAKRGQLAKAPAGPILDERALPARPIARD